MTTRVVYVERRRRQRRDPMSDSMNFMGNLMFLGFGAAIIGNMFRR